MAARQARLIVFVAACSALIAGPGAAPSPSPSTQGRATTDAGAPTAAARIVSLVPAATEVLYAIGAGQRVVGVSSYDSFPPAVKALPRVGALIDPDTERILALRPDLVVLYSSQGDVQARFERAGIRTFAYRHGGMTAVFATIRDLGAVTGRSAAATRLARDLQSRIAAVRAKVKGRRRPRTLLVFERQPMTLRNMYVSGGFGFMHDMLDAAGGANVFADVQSESVQPSHETLLARAPEVILEVRAVGLLEPDDVQRDRGIWSMLPSLPATRTGRIHYLVGEHLVVAGPRLSQGVETVAHALHPEAFR